ncbi:unnamed protein product [Arabis nemorensis]|uniref:Putative plant transposon protein domain-containing protein n=1 Tax=Arabis nemorensis TaxID=586526 RepID=A0A565CHK6_9BRAS|nr:unnamed protein product [Arabis nemorensis]
MHVSGFHGYVEDVIREFYAHLPSFKTHESEVKVFVRGYEYTFSAVVVNRFLKLKPLDDSEVRAEIEGDQVNKNELAQFLADDPAMTCTKLGTPAMLPRIASLYIVCGHNWMPTSNMTPMNQKRTRSMYKLAKAIRTDFGEDVFNQVLEVGRNAGTFNLMFPSLIYGIMTTQHIVELRDGEACNGDTTYTRNNKSGLRYLQKKEGLWAYGSTVAHLIHSLL